MSDELTVIIGRLRIGGKLKIKENVEPSFLDVAEEGLSFSSNVSIEGEAYLVDDHLVLELRAKTLATLPCIICNESFDVEVCIDRRHLVSLEEVKGNVYDYSEFLRQEIILEAPNFGECCDGHCPHRDEMQQYRASKLKNS